MFTKLCLKTFHKNPFINNCLNVNDETKKEYIQKILQLSYNDNEDTENNKYSQVEQLNITDFWNVDEDIIEHLFFMDLIRKLQSGYKLSSCDKLAGIMLLHVIVKIKNQVESVLEKATNLMLGLDGPNLASKIKVILQKIGPNKFAAVMTDNTTNYALAQNIISRGLKTWIETHWTTMFNAADSILRLKLVLEKVTDKHNDIIKENIVKIITSCEFFHDVNLILKVLELLKKTISSVEVSNTTFVNCSIVLIYLGKWC
ncbi:hypothetical protein GLOIN_2v1481073 [Rhizophagus clarus]|uniref:DUF659 domain-containing protein n=1 Tax=Rhizophagus clarus TaxID=94130 RepID=A0A8H3QFP9_9GLOM|nr:hypothetical protein GLOIN_2v1481073 [Rhizophagus clarus]